MTRPIDNEAQYAQLGALESKGWTTIFDSWREEDGSHGGAYCALAPIGYRERALRDPGWDLLLTEARPGFYQGRGTSGEYETGFDRGAPFGDLEPIVINREFHGVAPNYKEINQEFRLFHNLYWDVASREYKLPEEDGTLTTAIRFVGNRIELRTKLIRSFQAARQRDLLLFIDSVYYFGDGIPATLEDFRWEEETTCAALLRSSGAFSRKPFTRFLGTRVQPAPPVEASGMWPYEFVDPNAFPSFMFDIDDETGEPVEFTCNPDELQNNFGANSEAPHYLSSICFRREVLRKYFDNPELYTVEDGSLWCGSLWMLRLDNHTDDYVRVFLGDLGRDLPRTERFYWKTFNVPPEAGLSETIFRRAFLGQAAAASSPDLLFRANYLDLQRDWRQASGWNLFLDPEGSDRSMLRRVRTPLNDSQTEFETAITLLVKLLVDSLNEADIVRQLGSRVPNEKGIAKFERLLTEMGYPNTSRDIALLRALQELRSRGTAHRKGQNYDEVLTRNLGTDRGQDAIIQLLGRANAMLSDLSSWARDDSRQGPDAEEE